MNILRNATPWLAEALPFVNDQGREGHLVVVKLEYTIAAAGRPLLARTAEPLIHEDRYDGTGPDAPLLRPADVMAPQPSTNVMLFGHAQAPDLPGTACFEPWLAVGKTVFPMRVHGPRQWKRRWFATRALSLFMLAPYKRAATGSVVRLPLRWQHAYGGAGSPDGSSVPSWAANPAGTGYCASAPGAMPQGMALPAIEDPRAPILRWQDRRVPQLPGATSVHWSPRRELGGTRDAHWQATMAPAMPADGSARFHNTAHPSLQFTPHLGGGEPIQWVGFRADGEALAIDLPAHRFDARAYYYGPWSPLPLALDTVILEPDESRLTMLYRGFAPRWQDGFELHRLALGSAEHPPSLQP